jgi:hypothetical protein
MVDRVDWVAEGAAEQLVLTPVNLASTLFFENPDQIYARVHRELRPRTPVPAIEVLFRPFANADSRIRLVNGKITVEVADILQSAPAPFVEALAYILLGKLYRKPIAAQYQHRYRLFLNRREIRNKIDLVRQVRGRKVHKGPRGMVHDLEEIFERLNRDHFEGLMARPALGWSYVRSRTRLGHYDPSHHIIMISRVFDDPRVPRLALEYVMFHEMLHLYYPTQHKGTRRCMHTPEFKAHEKRFPGFEEAKSLLKKL